MKRVTGLHGQKRRSDRVNLHLDEAFAFVLPMQVASRLHLGQMLSTDELTALQAEAVGAEAKEDALRLIALRPRSMVEVERSLRSKGHDESLIAQVMAQLQEVGLLDDLAFARYWVEQREAFRPRGVLALRQELQQKGVSRDLIAAVLPEVDELASARRLAEKQALRWQQLPYEAYQAKMTAFLQRRGFPHDIIQEITNDVWHMLERGQN